MQVKKQQLELDMEQQTGSRMGKEYVKTVYCHPAYLTSMESSVQFISVTQSCLTLCDPMSAACFTYLCLIFKFNCAFYLSDSEIDFIRHFKTVII